MAEINLIGKNILGYTVTEKLGEGSYGTVYKVIKSNVAGQYVRALKHITIPTERQYNSVLNSMGGDISKADSYFAQMLNNIVSEIRILNDLSEKGVQHIVRYYENDIIVSEAPKRYDIFILMEYLTSLEDYIQSKDFLVRDVVRLGLDLLYGIQACHDNGVMHRDIKDDNIFVTDSGEYKIGDFGISKVLKDSSKADSLKGTPNFLAPEVYLGRESYTKSVDLYSLGIVLYRLLNYSRNPFLPRFPEQYFSQDEDKAFEERMSGKVPELPVLGGTAIGNVIVKAVSNSSDRFQTAEEFINALEVASACTASEVLNEKVKFSTSYIMPEENQYGETRSEILSQFEQKNQMQEEQENAHNRYLFESIGEISGVGTYKNEYTNNEEDANLQTNIKTGNDAQVKKTAKKRRIFPVIFIGILLSIILFVLLIGSAGNEGQSEYVKDDYSDLIETSIESEQTSELETIVISSEETVIETTDTTETVAETIEESIIDDAKIFPEQIDWSDWMSELPEYVTAENYEINQQILYSNRYLETTSSKTTDSMEGWELYNVMEVNGDFGGWSSWAMEEVAATETREVEKQTRYRYKDKAITTNSEPALNGWTLYNTTYSWSDYGNWSDWSTAAIENSDSRKVEKKVQYSYRTLQSIQVHTEWIEGEWQESEMQTSDLCQLVGTRTVYPYYYFYCTSCGTRSPYHGYTCKGCYRTTVSIQSGTVEWFENTWSNSSYWGGDRYYQNINGSDYWNWTDGAAKTQWKYKTRGLADKSVWGEWSSYSDTPVSASNTTEVMSRDLYRYCDRYQIPTYHFYKWGEWSDWIVDTVMQSDNRKVETANYYRYRDRVKEKVYHFKRWSDWSDWSIISIAESESVEVETKIQYSFKSKDK